MLARGGMGVVQRVFDRLAEREVALKRLVVPAGASRASCAALFEREYDALTQLRHPTIVRVFEYGLDADGPYYTMELLQGEDAYRAAPRPFEHSCALLSELASALALVHARRLVHRDVTPLNVRLTADGHAKLIDFGALTTFGVAQDVVGTPPFIAPECLRGEPLDARTDLFALGGLAYWLLTRKVAIHASSLAERLRDLAPSIAPPSLHVPGIPEDLDALVLALLHHDPMARPSSAGEVMRRLGAIATLPREEREREIADSYLDHPPLLGREPQRATARELLRRSQAGALCTVLVQAESGMGRSAFLDQLARDAQLLGATVLRAQGGAGARAFDVAKSLTSGGISADVTNEMPALSSPLATPAEVAERTARRVDQLERNLRARSEENFTVILVDDVGRADAESLAVLTALARRTQGARLLLAFAGDPSPGLALLTPSAHTLPLSPLTPHDMFELVTALFGALPNARRLAVWLHEQSAGSPRSALTLLRGLLQLDVLRYEAGHFTLPHDVGEVTLAVMPGDVARRRVQELGHDALRVAQVLALQGERVPSALLLDAVELPPPVLLRALEALAERGITRLANGEIWIGSDVLREAIAGTLDERGRRTLHLQVGRVLAARGHAAGDQALLVGANLLRGGDQAGGAMIEEATHTFHLGADFARAMPLLEELLARRRAEGARDQDCLPLLIPLSTAGYYGSYLKQCEYGDRALDAILHVSGVDLARRMKPLLGARLALGVALAIAYTRYLLTPRQKRMRSFRDVLLALLIAASAGVAAAVSAFDPKKAFDFLTRLRPLSAFPEGSAPRIAYEFALCTAVAGAGRNSEAAERYEQLAVRLAQPIAGLNEAAVSVYRLATQYGRAQSELSKGSPRTLELVEEMRGKHAFYAAHVESTRMAYFALRGEQALAEQAREHAELAALRNGMSWAALTILLARTLYAQMLTRDALGLVQTDAELSRLSETVPNMSLLRDLARGYTLHLNGHHAQALALFDLTLEDPRHSWLPTAWLNRTLRAEILRALGRHAEARAACLAVLADSADRLASDCRRHLPVQELALAEL
ncbi:MAG: AAA family ATPase, partial [Polyangiales bacterium]